MDRTSMTLAINTVWWLYLATHWGDAWSWLMLVLEVFYG